MTSHPECVTAGVRSPPTRLLELLSDGIRLCDSGAILVCPPYVTLSHCWGKLEILKLKRDNIDSLSDLVPIQKLCKTFREAIIVTRALGFHYLWIDSLCIIQDDEEDWRQESALMSRVYGNAVVNIAATSALDGSMGLFFDRDVRRASRTCVVTNTSEIYELMDKTVYIRCIAEAPLSSRAWIFQERYLAKRTLHFTTEQVFCECRCKTVCESWPKGILKMLLDSARMAFPTTRDEPDGWFQAVSLYSKAKLTFGKDKLIALSGIARKYQERTQDQYVAGLWRTNLERQLCWAINTDDSQTSCEMGSTQYVAPSWSWASTD